MEDLGDSWVGLLTAGLACATVGIGLEPGTRIGTYATDGLFALALAFLFAAVSKAATDTS